MGASDTSDADQVARLDDIYIYMRKGGILEKYPRPEPEPESEPDHVPETSITPQQTQQLDHAATLISTTASVPPPGASGYMVVNGQRVAGQSQIIATEQMLARAIAQNFVNNPHLLPPEDQQYINQFSNELNRGMPRPKSPDPKELAKMLLGEMQF